MESHPVAQLGVNCACHTSITCTAPHSTCEIWRSVRTLLFQDWVLLRTIDKYPQVQDPGQSRHMVDPVGGWCFRTEIWKKRPSFQASCQIYPDNKIYHWIVQYWSFFAHILLFEYMPVSWPWIDIMGVEKWHKFVVVISHRGYTYTSSTIHRFSVLVIATRLSHFCSFLACSESLESSLNLRFLLLKVFKLLKTIWVQ